MIEFSDFTLFFLNKILRYKQTVTVQLVGIDLLYNLK